MFRFEVTRTVSLSPVMPFALGSCLGAAVVHLALPTVSKYHFMNNYTYASQSNISSVACVARRCLYPSIPLVKYRLEYV